MAKGPAGGMAVDVNGKFALGKLAPGGFFDGLLESHWPGRHAMKKFRAFLGGERHQRAVVFAFRLSWTIEY